MSAQNLKAEILSRIQALNEQQLEELWGVLHNYLSHQGLKHEWESLSKSQQSGIHQSISHLENDEGIPHQKVMQEKRKRFND